VAIDRFMLAADRIIITKPGVAANVSAPEDGKIFDSNWDFTGTLLARGTRRDTAVTTGTGGTRTNDGTPMQVVVPLPFTPREIFIHVSLVDIFGAYNRSFDQMRGNQYSYSSGILYVNRIAIPNTSEYQITHFRYRVYSV
jgi:hypothetical protein